eukprot:52617-Eustigmatos_ZCMA.PRE.1
MGDAAETAMGCCCIARGAGRTLISVGPRHGPYGLRSRSIRARHPRSISSKHTTSRLLRLRLLARPC